MYRKKSENEYKNMKNQQGSNCGDVSQTFGAELLCQKKSHVILE
jgi:hypothetical protein